MNFKLLLVAGLISITQQPLLAQKGAPPKDIVKMEHTTNYAQHVDFKSSMLSSLKVPNGWTVSIAATGLGKPRMLWMNNAGQIYITRRDVGDVLLLTDTDHDHKFDDLQTVITDFKGVHGITSREGWLYACNNRELKRFKLKEDGTVGEMEALINDMPDGGQHGDRTMDFGPDGKLYLSVGSTCNDCFEPNKENATMLQIDPSSWKRIIYARGLRNTIGFDWNPATKELYGADNGADTKGDNWPPEELNNIKQEEDYGWPIAYGKQEVDKTREEPQGTTKAEYAKATQASVMEFPAHSAPIAFRFLSNAKTLPADWQDDALVCWHGSWDRSQPVGFKVEHIKFENGKAVGSEDFLTGFLNLKDRTRFGRPAGIAVAADGAIYISDDANGVLYCIQKNK